MLTQFGCGVSGGQSLTAAEGAEQAATEKRSGRSQQQ
jgi:hypothetical protein